jgi:hypothetical protein
MKRRCQIPQVVEIAPTGKIGPGSDPCHELPWQACNRPRAGEPLHGDHLEYGFSPADARLLVEARGLDGFRVSHHYVREYLANGATHDELLAIFQ